jgi:hypothetical protein
LSFFRGQFRKAERKLSATGPGEISTNVAKCCHLTVFYKFLCHFAKMKGLDIQQNNAYDELILKEKSGIVKRKN